ncbi:hypothetical protein GCM10020000_61460 [Streptomyces olivoverticillatus]
MNRTDALAQLPVRTALPALTRALDEHGAVVLCAPPGTGKTTLVPLALAGLTGAGAGQGPVRRVLVAEPRRIAARAAARRMAWLLGEEVGRSVGFTVRGERRAGASTVVEVVTTGVLLQRLQRDPELAGVDVVVLDECHERHLDADTAAAFLLDVRAALRPELRLVAASATTDAEGWARLLGGAPVVEAQSVSHPVGVAWAPPERPVRPPHGLRVDPVLLDHVAAVVRRALREQQGDVLCFLPGVGEIGRVAGLLASVDAEVLQVHGRAPAAVQDAVLEGGRGVRRVVLATSVAESSLTVPGVRVVVDSGLAREPRTDHARGAERADDRTGLPGLGPAAGGPGGARGAGNGVPLLGAGGGSAAARVPGRGDHGGRSDGVRLADGVLGRSGRLRPRTARPSPAGCPRGGQDGADGHGRDRPRRPSDGARPGDGAHGRTPATGACAARRRAGDRRAPCGRGRGSAERGAPEGVRRRSGGCLAGGTPRR